jgi:hypothetical protein
MSELPPDQTPPLPEEEPAAPLPRWVPTLIGVVLVIIASLAVITGLRYRDRTLVEIVSPRHPQPRAAAAAPPGEPEAGASLVSAGVPHADGEAIGANVVRMEARRGIRIEATPPDAMVYINNVPVGEASQFDSEDEIYDFAEPGSYTIRLLATGYKERVYVVTADDAARTDVARIQAKLEKE